MNPNTNVGLLGLLLSLTMLGGCATITRGTTEAFVVESDPSGANVRFSSGETCRTPCTLTRKRKTEFVIFVDKPGFEPVEVSVLSQTAGGGAAGMAGNVIFGGLIGLGVDASSGATKELVPNPVTLKLVPIVATPPLIPARPEEDSAPIGPTASPEADPADGSQR